MTDALRSRRPAGTAGTPGTGRAVRTGGTAGTGESPGTAGTGGDARAARTGGDAGISLVEVLVSMAVMGVLMAMVTAGILQVYRVTGAVEAVSTAQSQLHVAFQRLDKEIRYASWIGEPGRDAGAWYVEFAGTDPQTRVPGCRQLRLDTGRGVLQLLHWTPGSPPAAGTAGQTLTSYVVTDGLALNPPFQRQKAGSLTYDAAGASAAGPGFVPDYQRLRIRLTTRAGTGDRSGTANADIAFTALNTSRKTPSDNICSEGRPSP
ncbi:type II secretion system protein J [Planomonospora sp. ID82291]|uniref:PulJ/GspJ family protein n=1 Tax=Planomonospora sp. ID82291 TaxID=2738136 RepID=UPI0018C3DB78|nr:prepilin-type N-terminal cleavage/methylation domain-containing protein [Planomonospora sp. ID82291]